MSQTEEQDQKERKPQPRKSLLREYVEAIVIAVLIALFLRAYVVQAFTIPSGSMLPTLQIGDYLLVNKFIYGTEIPFTDKSVLAVRKPGRGDIIVFKYPEDHSRDFIKRVIAVPGDTVESVDKHIFINGEPVEYPFAQYTDPNSIPGDLVSPDRPWGRRDNFGPFTVPEGKLFVMGDNRDDSHDSRFWGLVDIKEIRGKAFIIYWSWDSDNKWPRFARLGSLIR